MLYVRFVTLTKYRCGSSHRPSLPVIVFIMVPGNWTTNSWEWACEWVTKWHTRDVDLWSLTVGWIWSSMGLNSFLYISKAGLIFIRTCNVPLAPARWSWENKSALFAYDFRSCLRSQISHESSIMSGPLSHPVHDYLSTVCLLIRASNWNGHDICGINGAHWYRTHVARSIYLNFLWLHRLSRPFFHGQCHETWNTTWKFVILLTRVAIWTWMKGQNLFKYEMI